MDAPTYKIESKVSGLPIPVLDHQMSPREETHLPSLTCAKCASADPIGGSAVGIVVGLTDVLRKGRHHMA